jgi:molecular chaperone DnaK
MNENGELMPGRLAIDFGTSNTVVALWDETLKQGVPLHIPEFGRIQQQVARPSR